jgi:hypothetical protein
MKLYEFTKSYQLFEEAQKYLPNGIYGPRTAAFGFVAAARQKDGGDD